MTEKHATLEVDYAEGRTRYSLGDRPRRESEHRRRASSFVSLNFQAVAERNSALINPLEEMTTPQKFQFYVLFLVEHIAIQIISALFIIADVSMAIAAIALSEEESTPFEENADIASWIFLSYFVLEIILRFIGIGPRIFVTNVWEMFDALVITVSVVLAIAVSSKNQSRGYTRLTIIGRSFRLVRLMRLVPQCRKCILSMRLTTSENKRRYREDGFDLDLTYITERVIAMSFPSEGYLALYRNPIEEVIKFFRKKHENHFMIYNLCSERQYAHQKFNNCVKRYMIDDHNVASMNQMLDFVKHAERYISSDDKNVIAVHCKGGKGRTGSMICAYLMYSDKLTYPTGLSAREFFASQRSDNRINSKCQGVQTPSQCRFIDYFGTVIHKFGCVIPEPPSLFVKTLIIHSPPSVIKMKNCDLLVEVCDRDKAIVSMNLLSAASFCEHEVESGTLRINFHDHVKPCVTGDTKIRFVSQKLPKKYDKASFYFWFNTTFIENGKLFIERELLDNPHFSKYNNKYDSDFGVTVLFDQHQRHVLV